MNKQNPVVIYVGSDKNVKALADHTHYDGWMVLQPQDMEDALAMQVFEYPDVFVIEDGVEFGREVFSHLSSVNQECIVLLTDRPEAWSIPVDSMVLVAPTHLSTYDLITAIRAKLGHEDVAFAL